MKESILKKTIELIVKKGVKFTTEDLARELETSKRTIYKHFETKAQLMDEVVDYVFDEIYEEDSRILNNDQLDIAEKLSRMTNNFPKSLNIGYLLKYRDDIERFYPKVLEKINQRIDRSWDVTIILINEAIAQKRIKPINTVVLKVMLIETLKTIIDYRFLEEHHMSFEEALTATNEILLAGIKEK